MHSTSSEPTPSESLVRTGRDGRLCFDASQRRALLDAFQSSGTSAMAFARQHGVKYQTFIAWLRKSRGQAASGATGPERAFAEVLLDDAPPACGSAGLRLILPCGTVVEIASRAALPLAVELMSTLRQSC